ncbi:hypothetical protein OVA14_03105 [Agrococcus sp. SL85]|uniref:hypothetical protein n=1 Tax=Agrococcus sp. SL85 TaxID=2995141 RepID=UPI00226C74AF|nr:hypothetical protein [Agrococcus sp. SL85]WAC66776.1 hypothetical protein OVA14_03105 [Agrococcus sp. SL85]
MEIVLVLLGFIVLGTAALLLVDVLSGIATKGLVGSFARLREARRREPNPVSPLAR